MGGDPQHPAVPEPVSVPSLPAFDYEAIETGERIGVGGNATVFRGRIEHDGDVYDVAVKEPRFEGTISRRVVERFETEAEVWSTLSDHDHVVTVHTWGTEPLPWLALEYMDGGTLDDQIGALDVEAALWLSGRIADAIHYGHRHGVAHLDITPSNVLLRETGPTTWPYPKVSDWGLAKLLLDQSTTVEGISPSYAAPEQFDRATYGEPDDRTDIYQLGAVIYALLTGQPPFTGSGIEVRNAVLSEPPRAPSAVNGAVHKGVDDIVRRAMAKDKSDRYESPVLLRQELDRLFEHSLTGSDHGRTVPIERSSDNDDGQHRDQTSDANSASDRLPVSRRTALLAVGTGAVGIGAGALVADSGTDDVRSDTNARPVEETSPEPDGNTDDAGSDTNARPAEETSTDPDVNTDVTYPSHTGRHEITAEDNYWAWEFGVNAPFVLEYTVTNLLDADRDFDVLLYPPSKFETYRDIATGREEGVRPAYLDGSRPGTRTEAAATVDLSAGTYYLVVDNTDLSDAGDFGTESRRRVRVDATTRER